MSDGEAISTGFGEAERARFRSLLALAAGSSFDGEREAALAAARRLAARHGMTLGEAARGDASPPVEPPEAAMSRRRREQEMARAFREGERRADAERARFRAAWQDALRRGLDRDERRREERAERSYHVRRSDRRLEPVQHATVLLNETRLPFREIADITGLDPYAVVGLKLKLRRAA